MGRRRRLTPLYRDDFHGRQQELADLDLLMNSRESRVTVLGPPGCGKTRLAREYALQVEARGQHVLFCDLTMALCADDVVAALERCVGWKAAHADLPELIAECARADLLVLDNAEHVASALQPLLQIVDDAAVPVLLTSRELLDWPSQVLELTPLELSPGLALFLQRARRRNLAFASTDEEIQAAEAIVQKLEGCPLAIELAASRAGRSSARVILEQLTNAGHCILAAPETTGRFDSLHAALQGSWDRLDEEAKRTLTLLATLQGPWTLATAAAVLAIDFSVALAKIEALRDRSLLHMADSARYRVYEIIREHALREASEDLRGDAIRRLTQHLVGECLGAEAFARPQALAAEPANLHVVLEGNLACGRGGLGLQALLRLRGTYLRRGSHEEYAAHLGRVAAIIPASESTRGDDILVDLAWAELACWRGNFTQAASHADRALDHVRRRGGDANTEAFLLAQLGNLQGALYAPERGMRMLEEAQRCLSVDAPPELHAYVQRHVATFLLIHDVDEAERRLERALALVRRLRHPSYEQQVLALLAVCRIGRGASKAAAAAVKSAKALPGEGAVRWAGILAMVEGIVTHEEGELVAAEALYQRACETFADDNAWLGGLAHLLLGDLNLEADNHAGCERAYARALELLRPLGEQLTTTWALAGLGALRARQGRRAEAERLFHQAEEMAERAPLPRLKEAVAIRRLELPLARGEVQLGEVEAMLAEARERSNDFAVRFPARILAARLRSTRTENALDVQRDGKWFAHNGGPRVSLARRKRLAALLSCLANATDWVTFDDLFQAGWPGEQCVPGSDVNRVHVTLSRLRGAGLGGLIETDEGRFRIVTTTRVSLAD